MAENDEDERQSAEQQEGEQRQDGTVMLSARIDAELRRRFHHRAIDEDVSVQELLKRLVIDYLDRHEKP